MHSKLSQNECKWVLLLASVIRLSRRICIPNPSKNDLGREREKKNLTEDGWKETFWVGAGKSVDVSVAKSIGNNLDTDLASLWWGNLVDARGGQ